MKRILYLLVFLIALVFGLTFALKNSQLVELVYYGGLYWQAPLAVFLLLSLLIGVVLGLIAGAALAWRRRRRTRHGAGTGKPSTQVVRGGVTS